MRKLSLKEIQEAEMCILDEIDRICRQLNITYFLGYGTLLGAARHQGFIPWDDDMDIFMLRKDYETLLSRFNDMPHDLPLKLLVYRDGVSNLPYAKVVDTSTSVTMKLVKEEYSTGIWVDVFPLDFIPSSTPPALLKEKAYFFARVLASSIPAPERPAWQNALIKFASATTLFRNPLSLAKKLDQAAQTHTNGPTDYLCDIVGEPEHPRCYLREWFSPIEMPFGSRTYLAPAGFESILETSYGDWRKLPPENQRIPHGAEAYRID